MNRRRQQGASNYVLYIERYWHLPAFSAFRIRTMGNTLCGSVVVIAIANTGAAFFAGIAIFAFVYSS